MSRVTPTSEVTPINLTVYNTFEGHLLTLTDNVSYKIMDCCNDLNGVNRWFRCTINTHFFIVAAQDVNLVRTKPGPEQLPCSQLRVEFICQIMVPSASLIWTLPTGEQLEFSILNNVGDIRNSSNNIYSANLTNKTEDTDPVTHRFLFSSSLLILQPVNGSNLTCSGGTVADPVKSSSTITLSGKK